MIGRVLTLLGFALLLTACAMPTGARSSDGPRTRCLTSPGRSETYASDRPLFFLFCIESP
jgi:hypothetical protein